MGSRFDRPQLGGAKACSSVWRCLCVSLIAALIRLWILGHTPVNADEAIVGLMAQQILHGHFSAFYWGQDYGGVEPYFVAALFAIFGQSAFALTLSAGLLSGVAAILVWRIGIRIVPPSAAVRAAVLSWIWPECTVWNSTREFGFRQATLVLGLCVLLQCLRIAQRPRHEMDNRYRRLGPSRTCRRRRMVVVARNRVLLAARCRRHLRSGGEPSEWPGLAKKLAAAACGAAIGAIPWFVASLDDHWGTLQRPIGSSIPGNTYGYRLGVFFSHVLPMILGLRVEGNGAWLGSPLLGKTLYAAALVGIVFALAVLAVNRRQSSVRGRVLRDVSVSLRGVSFGVVLE